MGITKKEIIEMYTIAENNGLCGKSKITQKIIDAFEGVYDHSIVDKVTTSVFITNVVDNYVVSTYEEDKVHNTFDDAMKIV